MLTTLPEDARVALVTVSFSPLSFLPFLPFVPAVFLGAIVDFLRYVKNFVFVFKSAVITLKIVEWIFYDEMENEMKLHYSLQRNLFTMYSPRGV